MSTSTPVVATKVLGKKLKFLIGSNYYIIIGSFHHFYLTGIIGKKRFTGTNRLSLAPNATRSDKAQII